jgi:hypothetical protein
MSEVAAVRSSRVRPRRVTARTVAGPFDGERLSVRTAAAAIAMLPLLVPGGPSNLAPIDLLIVIALGTAMLWTSLSGHRWRFPYVAPMALFVGGGAIGALRGPVPGTGAVALVQDVLLLLWCWALVNVASSPQRFSVLLRTWAYSSVGWALLLFAGLLTGTKALTGQSGDEGVRTSLTFVDPNNAANYFFLSLMVIWATQCPRNRNRRLAAYGVLLAAIFTTGSSGGLVSLAVGGGVAALFGIGRRWGPTPAISAVALGAVAIFALHSAVSISSIQNAAAQSRYAFVRDGLGRGAQSVESRQSLLQQSTGLYDGSGALGAGPVSTKARLRDEQAPIVKEAHDDYVAALLERGVIGFAGLVLLFAGLFVRSARFSTGPLSHAFSRAVPKPHALAGAIVGTFVVASVYEVLHMRHVWTLYAFVAALSIFGRESLRPAAVGRRSKAIDAE